MGNSSSKSSKASAKAAGGSRAPQTPTPPDGTAAGPSYPPIPSSQEALLAQRIHAHRIARSTRSDHPLLGLVQRENGATPSDKPRETRQEREARKLEKERQARLKERERSMREEHVDGGYLVTLGVYTGVEDFSKPVVRQLQIERRLAPFWRGLNEHSDAWTEAQLVAAARGLPIPAPDEIPPEMARTYSEASSTHREPESSGLTAPIPTRSFSQDTAASNPSSTQPTLSSSGPASPTIPSPTSAQLLRGRAKTLASLATGSKSSLPDLTPQEIYLPKDPHVNGQPVEAYLYKDASECPICFMYYPPYLNKTRCCDQPICSECFVQIKRPDPHPPEHEQPGEQRPPEEEADLLVSEVAACPFCVTPEFGITYDPPPFRRGLAYAKQANGHPLQSTTSAMSSSSSLNATGRRRTTSLSAQAPQVITTDRVRPDWAKKLADARAHVLRRSAAATALHNAAYVLGNQGGTQFPNLPGFRRRRSLFGDLTGTSSDASRGPGGLLVSPYEHLSRTAPARPAEEGNTAIYPPRGSSRRTRVDDLEELMMMEAIRQSLAAEEERKRKEDKEAKKEAKKKAKEEKKLVKKGGGSTSPVYQTGSNDSASTMASASMARSTSNLGASPPTTADPVASKGKQPAQDFAGFIPLTEPTSTLNTELRDQDGPNAPARSRTNTFGSMNEDAQKHLEESRANLHPANGMPVPEPRQLSPHARHASDTLSIPSSRNDSPSPSGSAGGDSSVPSPASGSRVDVSSAAFHDAPAARSGTPPTEPVLNFRSLTAMIEDETTKDNSGSGVAHEPISQAEEALKEPSPTGSPRLSPVTVSIVPDTTRHRGNSVESSSSASPPPPGYGAHNDDDEDGISPAPANAGLVHDVDSKGLGGIDVLPRRGRDVRQAATQ